MNLERCIVSLKLFLLTVAAIIFDVNLISVLHLYFCHRTYWEH